MKMWKKIYNLVKLLLSIDFLFQLSILGRTWDLDFFFWIAFYRQSLMDLIFAYWMAVWWVLYPALLDNGHSRLLALLGHAGTSLRCFNVLQEK